MDAVNSFNGLVLFSVSENSSCPKISLKGVHNPADPNKWEQRYIRYHTLKGTIIVVPGGWILGSDDVVKKGGRDEFYSTPHPEGAICLACRKRSKKMYERKMRHDGGRICDKCKNTTGNLVKLWELDRFEWVLFEELRWWRTKLSDEYTVPPYTIFDNFSLLEMVKAKPEQMEDLLKVKGVGPAKATKYGTYLIQFFSERADLPSSRRAMNRYIGKWGIQGLQGRRKKAADKRRMSQQEGSVDSPEDIPGPDFQENKPETASDYVSTLENKVLEFAAMREISASDTELQSILEVNRSRASQLLNSMHEKGMLERRRKGKKVLYKIPNIGLKSTGWRFEEMSGKASLSFQHNTLYKREISRIYDDNLEILDELKKSEQIDVTLTLPEIGTPDVSTFDPALTLNTGPTTSNLTTCFFLSNPNKKFSREEVFAHLNRHCEDWGIGDFFRTELKWDFTFSGHEHPLERELLQIGRNSVLREIANLERLGVLTKDSVREGRSKYQLADNDKTMSLQRMSIITRNGADYSKLISYLNERKRKIQDIHHVVNKADGDLKTLVSDWWGEVRDDDYNHISIKRNRFRSRLARLSYFSELTGEGFSTINRKWFELFKLILGDYVSEVAVGLPDGGGETDHLGFTDIGWAMRNICAELYLGKRREDDSVGFDDFRKFDHIGQLQGEELVEEIAKLFQRHGSFFC